MVGTRACVDGCFFVGSVVIMIMSFAIARRWLDYCGCQIENFLLPESLKFGRKEGRVLRTSMMQCRSASTNGINEHLNNLFLGLIFDFVKKNTCIYHNCGSIIIHYLNPSMFSHIAKPWIIIFRFKQATSINVALLNINLYIVCVK